MKKLALLLFVSAVLVFSLASNSMAWTLVYANDSNGAATFGNVQSLINAIREGDMVRFNVGDGDAIMDGQTVEIQNGVVCAQNTTHVSVDWQGGVMITQSNPYNAFYAVCTTGDVNISRWYVGSHTSAGVTQYKQPLKWFIDQKNHVDHKSDHRADHREDH